MSQHEHAPLLRCDLNHIVTTVGSKTPLSQSIGSVKDLAAVAQAAVSNAAPAVVNSAKGFAKAGTDAVFMIIPCGCCLKMLCGCCCK